MEHENRMEQSEIFFTKLQLAGIFTPAAPIDKSALFAGRTTQINKLLGAISQKGQHAILYGERGAGKTSLAKVLSDFLKSLSAKFGLPEFNIGYTTCEANSTFHSIFTSLLRDIKTTHQSKAFNEVSHEGTLLDLCPNPNSADDLRNLLGKSGQPVVFIIDEFDQLLIEEVRKSIADSIKTFSDNALPVTIIVVGVADSVSELIQGHISIERVTVQIPMPRMNVEELKEIISKGLAQVNMTIQEAVKERIANLSLGLPHYTHLLALHASQSAIDLGRREVGFPDLERAIEIAVEQTQRTLVEAYINATSGRSGNLYAQVLTACAITPKDPLGFFTASGVRGPMSQIMKRAYDIPAFSQHLNDFCIEKRSNILLKIGFPKRYKFRFVNPLIEPYVIMKGITKGYIEPTVLEKPKTITASSSAPPTPVVQSPSASP